MSEPFLAEIRMMSFNFAPKGWAMCNGQMLPINQNQALFALLGTTYGGNGQTTFALPNLVGRMPIHAGAGHAQGEAAGETAHTLTNSEMPQHIHAVQGTSNSTDPNGTNVPVGNLLAAGPSEIYAGPASPVALTPSTLTNAGGTQPHENRAPYLALNFCIALQGLFPSRN
ncbi:MAG TPA: tail fiber protein [Actinomycetota bacterium]|nr:tail fiber protein [Actinomycetota bacterium]